MINDIIYIFMALLGFALFVRMEPLFRGLATILLWCAAQSEAVADTRRDLGPHIWNGICELWRYQQRQANSYWQEVKEKR